MLGNVVRVPAQSHVGDVVQPLCRQVDLALGIAIPKDFLEEVDRLRRAFAALMYPRTLNGHDAAFRRVTLAAIQCLAETHVCHSEPKARMRADVRLQLLGRN